MSKRVLPDGATALRAALDLRGMSQGELERRIGCSKGTATRWLQGQHRPDVHRALQLERLLGLDPAVWETDEERGKSATTAA